MNTVKGAFFSLSRLHDLRSDLEAIKYLLLSIATEREPFGKQYSVGGGRVDFSPANLKRSQSDLRERLRHLLRVYKIDIVTLFSVDEFTEWSDWVMKASSDTMPIDLSDPDGEHPVGHEVTQAIVRTESWIRGLTEQKPDPHSVFLVNGRNQRARNAMSRFLHAIDLRPLGWDEAVALTGEGTPFVGDVLEKGFAAAQAVIVMLTGDDLAQLNPMFLESKDPDYEKIATPQPRPNVLFEAGFAFGRHPKRTILVEFGRMRPFSDVQGRYVIRMDNTVARRQELAERLRNAGCAVSLTGNYWHRAGAFAKLV